MISFDANHLTERCSRRLALHGESATGLFPSCHMIKMLPEREPTAPSLDAAELELVRP